MAAQKRTYRAIYKSHVQPWVDSIGGLEKASKRFHELCDLKIKPQLSSSIVHPQLGEASQRKNNPCQNCTPKLPVDSQIGPAGGNLDGPHQSESQARELDSAIIQDAMLSSRADSVRCYPIEVGNSDPTLGETYSGQQRPPAGQLLSRNTAYDFSDEEDMADRSSRKVTSTRQASEVEWCSGWTHGTNTGNIRAHKSDNILALEFDGSIPTGRKGDQDSNFNSGFCEVEWCSGWTHGTNTGNIRAYKSGNILALEFDGSIPTGHKGDQDSNFNSGFCEVEWCSGWTHCADTGNIRAHKSGNILALEFDGSIPRPATNGSQDSNFKSGFWYTPQRVDPEEDAVLLIMTLTLFSSVRSSGASGWTHYADTGNIRAYKSGNILALEFDGSIPRPATNGSQDSNFKYGFWYTSKGCILFGSNSSCASHMIIPKAPPSGSIGEVKRVKSADRADGS
ncbi:MAG: hypothetical protein M1825_003087 [Sarcosagium campestre]|nr:MAG: hypothetical protein M1825_003087 [Sarcosagium campestre]